MQHQLLQPLREGRFAAAKWHTTLVLCAWLIDHPHKREPDKNRVMQMTGMSRATFFRGLEGVRQIVSLYRDQVTKAAHANSRSSSPCERSKL